MSAYCWELGHTKQHVRVLHKIGKLSPEWLNFFSFGSISKALHCGNTRACVMPAHTAPIRAWYVQRPTGYAMKWNMLWQHQHLLYAEIPKCSFMPTSMIDSAGSEKEKLQVSRLETSLCRKILQANSVRQSLHLQELTSNPDFF